LALNQSIFLIYLPFTEVCVENYKNPMVTKTDRNENVFKIPPKRSFSARGHINVGKHRPQVGTRKYAVSKKS
jgi:hypothetical protein